MNRFKFQAMQEEFPFLKECNKLMGSDRPRHYGDCQGIHVKRINTDLLARTPQYNGATGSLVGIHEGERFDFVMSDGSVIRDAVKDAGHVTHNEAYQDNESWDGETVLEAIDRHNSATLKFIVLTGYGHDIQDHHSGPAYTITIYKAAAGCNIDVIIASAKGKARAVAKHMSAF